MNFPNSVCVNSRLCCFMQSFTARAIENLKACLDQAELDAGMWRGRFFDICTSELEKDKKVAQLNSELEEFQLEFRKRGLEGLAPAQVFGIMDRYMQNLSSSEKELKCDLYEARQQWAALWAKVEEYDAEDVGIQVDVEDNTQMPIVPQLPAIVEIESGAESDEAPLIDEDVPSDPDLVDAHIDYDEPISQDILTEAYEDTVMVLDRALVAEDLVRLTLEGDDAPVSPRVDENQVIELARELAEVKGELRVAVENRAKLQMERDAAIESANVFKTSNHTLSVKISCKSLRPRRES